MTYISDFKSAVETIFKQCTSASTGTGPIQQDAATYVGQKFALNDGREVVFVANGAVPLTSGVLVQGPILTANHQGLAVAVTTYTAAIGATQVSVTLGATLLKTNQYQGGYLVVDSGTGIGQTLRISGHLNAAASAAGVVINLEDPLVVALDATSTVCLIPNQYNGVLIEATGLTATPVGVSFYPISASTAPTTDGTTGKQTVDGVFQYGFLISKGAVSCLSDANTATTGLGVMPSTSTAGCVAVQTATGANIGRALQATVSAKARCVYIDL
jgi:hypothetical protein